MVKGMDLAWIVVSDLEKAVSYFTEVVGLTLKERHDDYGWAEFEGSEGGFRLGVAKEQKGEVISAGKNAVLTFTVDNLEKTKEKLKKKGVHFVGDTLEIPGHVKLQTISDKDGNFFQLVEKLA